MPSTIMLSIEPRILNFFDFENVAARLVFGYTTASVHYPSYLTRYANDEFPLFSTHRSASRKGRHNPELRDVD